MKSYLFTYMCLDGNVYQLDILARSYRDALDVVTHRMDFHKTLSYVN